MAEKKSDGKVSGYTRIVNGKAVQVGGYTQSDARDSDVVSAVRASPGRPQMPAKSGTFSRGRSIPGVYRANSV